MGKIVPLAGRVYCSTCLSALSESLVFDRGDFFFFSPVKDTVVTNDRWGYGTICKHGGYYTCADRYNPGHLLKHKWENCMTIDQKSWGYRREAVLQDYLSAGDIIKVSNTKRHTAAAAVVFQPCIWQMEGKSIFFLPVVMSFIIK